MLTLRATVHYRLHVVEQLVEIEALGFSYVVQRYATVYHLYDLELALRLVWQGDDPHDVGALDVVLLAIFLYELYERLAELVRLALPHALYLLQLLHGLGERGSHLRERYVLEDDIRREVMLLGHVVPQAFKLLVQGQVERGGAAIAAIVAIHELAVGHDGERARLLEPFLSRRRDFQKSIVLNVLPYVPGYHALAYDRIPDGGYVVVYFLSVAKLRQLVVAVPDYMVGGASTHEVNDIVLLILPFQRLDGREHALQGIGSLDVFLWTLAVVAVAAIVLCVRLAKVVEQHFLRHTEVSA